jgi:hypothetical protein
MNWWVFRTEILGVGHIHAAAAWTSAIEDSGPRIGSQSGRGERLPKSVQCTEEPMSDFIARSGYAYSSLLPTHFKIVCLFGLLGLALAAAVIPTAGEP